MGIASVNRIMKKDKETKIVSRKAKSSRTRISDKQQDQNIIRIVKEGPKKTTVDVMKEANKQMALNISVRTTSRGLKMTNLFARRKPLISKKIL